MKKIIKIAIVSIMSLTVSLGVAHGQGAPNSWPNKPIHLLVGFAPGGPTDNVARIIAKGLGQELGQPVIVENKAGAGGNIAANLLKQAAPDGYTFLYNTSSIVIAPWVYQSVGFDPLRDFTPVGLAAAVPLVLVVNNKVPARSPKELIDLIRANPNKLNYASSGTGAIEHLTAAHLLSLTATQATHVPYKGTAPAQVDLIAGATQFTTTTLNTALSPVKNGELRALAITSKTRSPLMPEVPTVDEILIPGFESLAWQGIVGPGDTPDAIVEKMNLALNKVLRSDAVKESLKQQGTFVLGGSPQEYSKYIREESARWKGVVAQAGVTAQ